MKPILAVRQERDTLVISPQGAASSLAEPALALETAQIVARLQSMQRPGVVLDFTKTTYFGASMLESMQTLDSCVSRAQGRMVLCNVPEIGREVLRIAQYHDRWPVFDSQRDALAELHRLKA